MHGKAYKHAVQHDTAAANDMQQARLIVLHGKSVEHAAHKILTMPEGACNLTSSSSASAAVGRTAAKLFIESHCDNIFRVHKRLSSDDDFKQKKGFSFSFLLSAF